MAYGRWQGLETALPGGINAAQGIGQLIQMKDNIAFNRVKQAQMMKQLEEEEQPVPKELILSQAGITDMQENRNKVFNDIYGMFDTEGKGYITRRDFKLMQEYAKHPMIQEQVLNAKLKDQEAYFTDLKSQYETKYQKARETGKVDEFEKDPKMQQLKEQIEREGVIYGGMKAKASGVEKSAHDYELTQRMHERELERRITKAQEAEAKLADTAKRMETYLEKQRLANEGKVAAKGTGGGKGGAKSPAPTADMKEFESARRSYTDNGLALPPHLQSIDVYKAWKKALPGPPKQGQAGGGGLSGLMNNQSAPKANYKDMGNGVLQYIRPE